ncbi:hypothetical protein [Botrimarina mediterranea]|uniref:hypothetical protein n=1 Tax=Botrimarina mediterranea TaxID=2528022 RepID=UPI00119DAE7B|nr:hypothetical protein [Botrimarina mediterranea]
MAFAERETNDLGMAAASARGEAATGRAFGVVNSDALGLDWARVGYFANVEAERGCCYWVFR